MRATRLSCLLLAAGFLVSNFALRPASAEPSRTISPEDVSEALDSVSGIYRETKPLSRSGSSVSRSRVVAADTALEPAVTAVEPLVVRSATGQRIAAFRLPAENEVDAHISTEGLALYPEVSTSTSGAVQLLNDGAVRIMLVLHDQSAPEEYLFPMDLPPDIRLKDAGNGGAYLLKRGVDLPVGAIESPWGRDASSRPVGVRQRITDSGVHLTVNHKAMDHSYPLVVDPTYSTIPCSTYSRDGTEIQYLRGNLCPVAVFFTNRGYWPVRSHQPEYPWRNGRQSGECSWMPDTGPFWDFQTACKAHDYCYDLRRETHPAVYPAIDKQTCDNLFDQDLATHCNSRSLLIRGLCNAMRQDMMLFVSIFATDPRP